MIAHSTGRYVVYAMLNDVTRVHTLLKANQELSDRLEMLVASVPCGILLVEACASLKICYFNHTAADMLGFSAAEFRQRYCADAMEMVIPADREAALAALRKIKDTPDRSCQLFVRLLCKDGRACPIWLIGHRVGSENQTLRLSIIMVEPEENQPKAAGEEQGRCLE